MIFKTLLHSSLIFSLFFVIRLSADEQANSCVAAKNSVIQATAVAVEAQATTVEVEDVTQSQSEWLFRNEFQGNSGFFSTRLLANDDPAGGKTCELADDIPVPAGETWTIDTIKCYLFWKTQQADEYRVYIYRDEYGMPVDTDPLIDFTFTVDLPNELTIYNIDVNTTNQNITLSEGQYWLSIIGVYNNLSMADSVWTAWNRKDTLLGNAAALARDSIGLCYTSYPTGWLAIYCDGENPENSLRFWIRGTRATDINTVNFQKPKSLVSVYPNPASEHIMFCFDKTNGKYIEIYDVMGKLVKTVTTRTKNQKVNIKSFTNGIYFYQLLDKSGNMVERGKFSVSK